MAARPKSLEADTCTPSGPAPPRTCGSGQVCGRQPAGRTACNAPHTAPATHRRCGAGGCGAGEDLVLPPTDAPPPKNPSPAHSCAMAEVAESLPSRKRYPPLHLQLRCKRMCKCRLPPSASLRHARASTALRMTCEEGRQSPGQPSLRSFHPGLTDSTRATFFALVHPLSCFSLWIAVLISLVPSK